MTLAEGSVHADGTTLVLPYRPGGWTVDDLPDDVDFHYELVDGAVVVSPAPDLWHDDLAAQLLRVVFAALPEGFRAGLTPGLFFDARNYRQPDLLVYRREAVARGRALPEDTLLAVEVMSPSSVTNDRVTKPVQLAAAGVPHFWRIERDPLVLLAHELEGDSYRESGRFPDEVDVQVPFPMRFRLSDLLP